MNNVTLIDDLPNLDDLETPPATNINSGGLGMIPDPSRYKKFIRNSGMSTPIESGMQFNTPKPQTYPPLKNKINREIENLFPEENIQGEYKPYIPSTYENFDVKVNPYLRNTSNQDVNCIQCANHTEHCTVCSKLYSNNNMVFVFVIIFQAILILLLIKKILE